MPGLKLTDPTARVTLLREAENQLRRTLTLVVASGAPQTAKKVRSAIKSIGGAIRHADGLEMRATEGRR